MKLYTEEDIENAFNSGRGYGIPNDIKDLNSFIKSITPIKLPSDEEILDEAYAQRAMVFSFTEGAIWMRDKIQGGNNGNNNSN